MSTYYAMFLYSEDDNNPGYIGFIPDYPNVCGFGKTLAECIIMTKSMLESTIELDIRTGAGIVEPTSDVKVVEKQALDYWEELGETIKDPYQMIPIVPEFKLDAIFGAEQIKFITDKLHDHGDSLENLIINSIKLYMQTYPGENHNFV